MDVGQADVSSTVAVGEVGVIDTQQMEHVGMQVVHGQFVFNHPVAVFVGGAVNGPPFNASAGHPQAESLGIVIAAVGALGKWGASEFSTEDQEGALQKSACFQILNEGCNGLIDG